MLRSQPRGEVVRSWGASAVLGSPQVEHLAWFPPGGTAVSAAKRESSPKGSHCGLGVSPSRASGVRR
ncbi:hypothetical protein [Dendronalium sp. ChiSLP03b]|uniref:hypothetical protein n=1 Tax=Dendronalium sp. ChiSLP03b TaxID=3075381 RepID=UPI002AD2FE4D|nr:hypothetical protein [Dendronalium sp. ChiSLP03b]MDZ8204501.1 hypothetical protein [Dendronalium sp. ChiSLP03b]